MKITIILILIPLLLSSTKSSFNYENFFEKIIEAVDFKDVYDKLNEAIDNIGNILFDEEKKNVIQMLGELLIYFIDFYKNNKEYVEKLENLRKKLKEYGFSNKLLINGGLSFLDKTIDNILKSKLDENYKNLGKIEFLFFNFPFLYHRFHLIAGSGSQFWISLAKLRKNQFDAIKKIHNRIKVFKYFKYAANAFSAFTKAKDKISKCKNKTTKAYFISSAQAITNAGTNIYLGSIGSFLGSFIPIPFLGTFAGGMVGNYIGDYINSLYDFDC